jgi:hypothetical protein
MLSIRQFGLLATLVLIESFAGRGAVGEDTKADVASLISELGSNDYSVRQRATMQLQAGGQESLRQIVAILQSSDSEVRSRVWNILLACALSQRGEVRDQAREAIRQLSQQSAGDGNATLLGGLSRVREAMSGLAVAELTQLGAMVSSVQSASPFSFNVQIGQAWQGGDDRLALLGDLGTIPWLSLENSRVTDAALDHLARLAEPYPGIHKLYLGSSGISGDCLGKLAPLKRLQYLSLKQLPVDDARIAGLPDFPELQYLGLDGTKIGDEGLAHLARYPRLQVIWLDNTAITDAGLVHLKRMANLDTLYMPGTKTGGAGLAELRYVLKLKSLSLKGVKFSPDSLKSLAQVEQLESLGLDMTNVTDDQLADLAGLKQLRILWLSGTKIGDEGIEHLKALRSLQIVHLNNTQVSREGVAEIERALPRCQVTIDFSNGADAAGHGSQPRIVPPRMLPRMP